MMTFLLVLQAIVAASLVGVILVQKSEGGGLGMGGSPTGLMSARDSANFLTRATTILASIFVLLCIVMAVMAAHRAAPGKIDTSLKQASPITAPQPAPAQAAPVPLGGDPAAAANASSLGDIANGAAQRSGQAR